MKLVKLSLAAAVAAGALTTANAVSFNEAMSDVDVSGLIRYRYDTGRVDNKKTANFYRDLTGNSGGIGGNQDHKYRIQLDFKAAIADNFKAYAQFMYNSTDFGYTNGNEADADSGFALRQLYLGYENADYATTILAGKQQLNTIWTDNGSGGLVGTGIKVLNNSFGGTTLAAFAFDDYSSGATLGLHYVPSNILTVPGHYELIPAFGGNIYGAAILGSYEMLGGTFNPQLWAAYMADTAVFYAVDLAYTTTIFDNMNWTLEGAYLGNSLDSTFEDAMGKNVTANGNFFALRGSIEWNGFDASLGGLYYGDDSQYTITTIEDQGNLGSLLAGQEIFYTDGSNLNGDVGKNTFGYITLGYTFNEVLRLGGDFVYGGTDISKTATAPHFGGAGDKMEIVARVDYKYTPKLSFSAFYSYLDVSTNSVDPESKDGEKNTVRLQALYKF